MQKFESGGNRVSASRLSAMAEVLSVPIAVFFGGLQLDGEKQTSAEQESRERLELPETIALVRLYYAIPDENVRHQFLQMVKAIAASPK